MCSTVALAVALGAGPALTAVRLPEDMSVTDRPRPDYDPVGMHAGAFVIVPRIEIGENYDSNVFAAESNTKDDLITVVRPSISVRSETSNHMLGLHADGAIGRYMDEDDENYEDFTVLAEGRLDIERQTQVSGAISFRSLHEERTSSDDASSREPVQYSIASAWLRARHEFNRLSVQIDGRIDHTDFDDSQTAAGVTINEDDRDRDIYTTTLRAGYELAPEYEGFIRGTYNRRAYDQSFDDAGVNRDSSGYEIALGATADFTGVTFGEVYAGYLSQDYDDAQLQTVDGFSFGATVTWNPTTLTTVKANAERLVRETTRVGTSGVLRSALGLSVDHELLRQLLVHAGVGYATEAFEGTSRDDDLIDATVGLRYLINRNYYLGADYRYSRRSSNAAGEDFDQNIFMLRLGMQY